MRRTSKKQRRGKPRGANAKEKIVANAIKQHAAEAPRRSVNNKTTTPSSSTVLPRAFPKNLTVPKQGFLRDVAPFQASFRAACETSYEGFVVDGSEIFSDGLHTDVATALGTLENEGFFRTDVTQPFGLGTLCAKTYVTRCCLGEPGTTYKYLGLRMFAFPWNYDGGTSHKQNDSSNSDIVSATGAVAKLNQSLTDRTRHHLETLSQARRARGEAACQGRGGFDIVLINRMTDSTNLKPEPMHGDGRCSVSWHADSSLEHYSTIAVYHVLQDQQQRNKTSNKKQKAPIQHNSWSVALRVAHNAEGPTAGRGGAASHESGSTKSTDPSTTGSASSAPPIAVSLPSRSTYYLLDDFNHHHQHAVITDNHRGSTPVRYSLTHRLLRSSHNVSDMIARCQKAVSQFHRKGPKLWRSEQLLLTELESEWLRQYFVQGAAHHDLMWPVWGDSIASLLVYWQQLETRTKSVVDLLAYAAHGACRDRQRDQHESNGETKQKVSGSATATNHSRKFSKKCQKAVAAVRDIIQRENNATAQDSTDSIFEPLAELLSERATMRKHWDARETDGVFREMDACHRPLAVPFSFSTAPSKCTARNVELAISPLPGTPEELLSLCRNIRACGKAWASGDVQFLVDLPMDLGLTLQSDTSSTLAVKGEQSSNSRSLSWTGWNTAGEFGLEMQSPWGERLLNGEKTIETRGYDLPRALVGKPLSILQSRPGKDGVSSLADTFATSHDDIQRIGWCIFDRVIQYKDKASFEKDEDQHLVSSDSGYAWRQGETTVIYGWVVKECGWYSGTTAARINRTTWARRMRSIFELQQQPIPTANSKNSTKEGKGAKRKKRKRY